MDLDSSITARVAKHVEQQNSIEIHCAGATKQAEEQKKKNREIILKLMIYMYFLYSTLLTTYKELIELQVLATNCLKSILVKGHLMLSSHQSVLGC